MPACARMGGYTPSTIRHDMDFLIYGAGAVGSLIGARLSSSHQVTLLARTQHARAIAKAGLSITETDGRSSVVQIRAIDDLAELTSTPDYVVVTAKAFDSDEIATQLSRFAESYVVSLQNGLGNEESFARHHDKVIAAVINQGAVLTGPGEIVHAGGELTLFGPYSEMPTQACDQLVRIFVDCGVAARRVDNIADELWTKAIINSAVNPLSALTRKRSGELLDAGPLERTIDAILAESISIAIACGAKVAGESLASDIRRILQATRTNKTSMLQDIERGRRTEIESMNGALARRARQKGIPAPVNQLMADLVRALEPPREKNTTESHVSP